MKKVNFIRTFIFLIIFTALFSSPMIVINAQNSYELLAPLPEQISVSTGNFADYAQKVITWLVSLAAVLAVVMIVVGGFQYMTSESVGMKEEGRERIKNAILGLLLLLASYLILYTINPQLLNLNLNPSATSGPPPPPPPSTPALVSAPADTVHAQVASQLADYGIGVSSSGGCSDPNRANCTSLTGIQPTTVAGLVGLKQGFDAWMQETSGTTCSRTTQSCQIIITGGTEVGAHEQGDTSHQAGYKVDISTVQRGGPNFTTYLEQQIGVQNIEFNTNYTVQQGNYTYTLRKENNTNPPHWDIKIV